MELFWKITSSSQEVEDSIIQLVIQSRSLARTKIFAGFEKDFGWIFWLLDPTSTLNRHTTKSK